MTQDEAKMLAPIIAAWGNGKTIQSKATLGSGWNDVEGSLCFNMPSSYYRIKPEPKLRPWRPEEVPIGAMFKLNGSGTIVSLLSLDGNRLWFLENGVPTWNLLEDGVFYSMAHSIDSGKTWLPCGVEETQ